MIQETRNDFIKVETIPVQSTISKPNSYSISLKEEKLNTALTDNIVE